MRRQDIRLTLTDSNVTPPLLVHAAGADSERKVKEGKVMEGRDRKVEDRIGKIWKGRGEGGRGFERVLISHPPPPVAAFQ